VVLAPREALVPVREALEHRRAYLALQEVLDHQRADLVPQEALEHPTVVLAPREALVPVREALVRPINNRPLLLRLDLEGEACKCRKVLPWKRLPVALV